MALCPLGDFQTARNFIGLSQARPSPGATQACLLKLHNSKQQGSTNQVMYWDAQDQRPLVRCHSKVSLWQQKPIKIRLVSSL